MKYAVLTSKHHDGFCLWPSRFTPYSVANSPRRQDVVQRFVEEFRKVGIQPGLYYSLWDRNYPQYADDEVYAQFMRDQIGELLTNYGPIVELWFDGAWDKDHPAGKPWYDPAWEADPSSGYTPGTRYQWKALYEHIHALQPDCLVLNNSSSNRPGGVRYHPVDARTAEHFNFVFKDEICRPNYTTLWNDDSGSARFLPLEFCASLAQNWFYQNSGGEVHPSAATIADWHRTAREHGANLLLNVGPNTDGLIPAYNAEFLREARRVGGY
jgi:alpha-L-fucosidase